MPVVQIKITREDGWPEYREQRYTALRSLWRASISSEVGQVEVLEGSHDGRRLVVFEFPSMEVIRSVWNSPEYERVKKLREGSGELDVWAVPGVS